MVSDNTVQPGCPNLRRALIEPAMCSNHAGITTLHGYSYKQIAPGAAVLLQVPWSRRHLGSACKKLPMASYHGGPSYGHHL
jgi:hypothetical protein